MKMRRSSRIWDAIVLFGGLALAIWILYEVFCLFLTLAMAAGEPERREAVLAVTAAVPEETGADEAAFEIYREGDGPAPAWYDPSEPMAAEWSAEEPEKGGDGSSGAPERGVRTTDDNILDVPLDAEFQTYLHGLCVEYGVPYTLAVAVIEAESTYRADAVSGDGDYGLMQINWRCHEWLADELGIVDFLDAYQNAKAGVWILGGYYRQYGAESGTLMAYNMGQAAAEALFARGIYETDYSRRVISIRWRIENGGAE